MEKPIPPYARSLDNLQFDLKSATGVQQEIEATGQQQQQQFLASFHSPKSSLPISASEQSFFLTYICVSITVYMYTHKILSNLWNCIAPVRAQFEIG